MSAIIGIVVVFGATVGGYLMEHGNLSVLVEMEESPESAVSRLIRQNGRQDYGDPLPVMDS